MMNNVLSSVLPKLRSWNTEERFNAVSSASSSNDGRFVAIRVEDKFLVVVHSKFFTEDLLLSETKGWEPYLLFRLYFDVLDTFMFKQTF